MTVPPAAHRPAAWLPAPCRPSTAANWGRARLPPCRPVAPPPVAERPLRPDSTSTSWTGSRSWIRFGPICVHVDPDRYPT